MLVVGTSVLIWLLLQRQAAESDRQQMAEPLTVDLPLPPGARIEQVIPAGNRLVLMIRGVEEQQYLALVNPLTGERLSLIRAVPEPR